MAVRFQWFASRRRSFFSGIFVVSAVDEADVFGVKLYQADAGWALDIVALIGYLY